ncbi:MAG: GNAT family N-acetyltransferase [Xanthobacteraceae bacterium]
MLLGAKITLGPFVSEDYGAMYCWANDIAAARLDGPFRPVNLVDVVRQLENAGKDPSRVMFAIRKRNEPAIIGYLYIQNISSVHRSGEIIIRIGEERNRGQGYAKEALRMALDYCWRHLNLNRVGLTVFRDNQRAIRAYKAVGFRAEGRLRKFLFIDGAWVDVLLMAAFRPLRTKREQNEKNLRILSLRANSRAHSEVSVTGSAEFSNLAPAARQAPVAKEAP